MKKAIFVAVLLLLVGPGCARVYPYHALSSHTILVGDKQEADVLWVGDLRDDSLLRCYNSPQGPKCVRVQQ